MDRIYVRYDEIPEIEAPEPYTRTAKLLFDRANDAEMPFCAGLFRLKPGQSGPPHAHENEVEIYVILQGEGTITIDGKKTYPLTPEGLLWVPPKTLHETVSTGKEDLLVLGIFVPPIDFGEMKKNWKKI